MFDLAPGISGKVKKNEIYYTLVWSALKKADKYEITLKVPSVSGLYELYRMDKEKKLNLLAVTHAWYGGLRSQLRAAVDPAVCGDLFFVSRNDGTHAFCPDLACHNENVHRWQRAAGPPPED